MKQYKDLVQHILDHGNFRGDRTGTGTLGVFGYQMRFDLSEGFPLVGIKNTFFKGVVAELLWMLRGDTNIKYLNDNGVHIWDEWADEHGNLGPVYGAMWRDWPVFRENTDSESEREWDIGSVDQIAELLKGLRDNPFSRRHIVSGWNPAVLPSERRSPKQNAAMGLQALPPCHTLFQFYVSESPSGRRILSCQLYQRSADVFLGVPFNIASYALLTMLIAHKLGYGSGEFIWTGGDCHLYSNHMMQVTEMMRRKPGRMPVVYLNHARDKPLWEVEIEDIELVVYRPQGAIKAPVSV